MAVDPTPNLGTAGAADRESKPVDTLDASYYDLEARTKVEASHYDLEARTKVDASYYDLEASTNLEASPDFPADSKLVDKLEASTGQEVQPAGNTDHDVLVAGTGQEVQPAGNTGHDVLVAGTGQEVQPAGNTGHDVLVAGTGRDDQPAENTGRDRTRFLTDGIARLALHGPAGVRSRDLTTDPAADLVRSILKSGSSATYAALWSEHCDKLRTFAQTHHLRPGDSRFWFSEGIARRLAAQAAQQQQDRDRRNRLLSAMADEERAAAVDVATVVLPPADYRRYRVPAVRPGDQTYAVHEAGHSCVALANGWNVPRVDVLQRLDDQSMGRTQFAPRDGATIFGKLLATLAGGEAERRQWGFIEDGHDADDLAHVRRDLMTVDPHMTAHDLAGWIDFLRAEAADEVARCWPWILRVAAALRRSRSLSQQQIEALRDISSGMPEEMRPPILSSMDDKVSTAMVVEIHHTANDDDDTTTERKAQP